MLGNLLDFNKILGISLSDLVRKVLLYSIKLNSNLDWEPMILILIHHNRCTNNCYEVLNSVKTEVFVFNVKIQELLSCTQTLSDVRILFYLKFNPLSTGEKKLYTTCNADFMHKLVY